MARDPDAFRARFAQIRRRISKLDGDALAEAAMTHLWEVELTPVWNVNGWLPWNLLLIVRWAFEYGRFDKPAQPVFSEDLVKLMNLLHNADALCHDHLWDEPHGMDKRMRVLARQQFWWQRPLDRYHVARPWALLHPVRATTEARRINLVFYEKHGLSANDFFELSFFTWSWLTQHRSFTISMYRNSNFPRETLEAFLFACAVSTTDMQLHVRDHSKRVKSPEYQFSDRRPFVLKPLLNVDGIYLPFSRRVFEEFVRTALFEVARDADRQQVGRDLGDLQEEHILAGLRLLKLPLWSESELAIKLGAGKTADAAVLLDDTSLVVVESKAIDLSPYCHVNPSDRELRKELKGVLDRAIVQAFSTVARFKSQPAFANHVPYVLVVTQGELHFFNGLRIWEEVLKSMVEPLLIANKIPIDIVPPERIFIVSLEEFDTLMAVSSEDSSRFKQILDSAAGSCNDIESAKLYPHQLINEMFPNASQVANHLEVAYKDLIQRTLTRFGPEAAAYLDNP